MISCLILGQGLSFEFSITESMSKVEILDSSSESTVKIHSKGSQGRKVDAVCG